MNPSETELFVICEAGDNSKVLLMSVVAATGAAINTFEYAAPSLWAKPRTSFYFDDTRVYFELQKLDPNAYVTPAYYVE